MARGKALVASLTIAVATAGCAPDRRYYFFPNYRPGFLGRLWRGYDTLENREFDVITLARGLLFKWGRSTQSRVSSRRLRR
jgi:hypothetical protein